MPGLESFRIGSVVSVLDTFVTVDNLFSHVFGMWNKSLIRCIFDPNEVNAILRIALEIRVNEDKLIWHFTPNGEYSTKSGYKVVHEFLKVQNETSLNPSGPAPSCFWIWNMGVPNKVRHFL